MAQTATAPIAIRPNLGKAIRELITDRYEYRVVNGMDTLRDTSFRPRPANPAAIDYAIHQYGLQGRTVIVEIRTWEEDFMPAMQKLYPKAMLSVREVPCGNHELRILYIPV